MDTIIKVITKFDENRVLNVGKSNGERDKAQQDLSTT